MNKQQTWGVDAKKKKKFQVNNALGGQILLINSEYMDSFDKYNNLGSKKLHHFNILFVHYSFLTVTEIWHVEYF